MGGRKSCSGHIFLKRSLEDCSTATIQKGTVIQAVLIATMIPANKILKIPPSYALLFGISLSFLNDYYQGV